MGVRAVFSWYQRILVLLFLVVFFSPAIAMMCGERVCFSYTEKRSLAAFPAFAENYSRITDYFSGVETYLNDHFGFREWFIRRYQQEVKKRFGIVGDNVPVLKGVDDWYYYTGEELLRDFMGKIRLSDHEIATWISAFRKKKEWLAKKGIRYFFIVPPNKQSVYPEFVYGDSGDGHGVSQLQQLKAVVPDDIVDSWLDLSTILISHTQQGALYYKSDTHWTPRGAYIAYQAIAKKIESIFPNVAFKTDFSLTPEKTRVCEKNKNRCGDLVNMLLDYDSFKETYQHIKAFPKCARPLKLAYQPHNPWVKAESAKPSFAKQCPGAHLKAIVFMDSFFYGLEPFFSENFAQVWYIPQPFDHETMDALLQEFQPDIVVEEKVERFLFK